MRLAVVLTLLAVASAGNALAFQSKAVPEPSIVCLQAKKAPVIDGKLDDQCWHSGPVINNLNLLGNKGPAKEQTSVFMTYNSQGLYVGFRCAEPDMSKLKLDETEKLWRNDSVEVMIEPGRDRRGYYQFVLTASGAKMQIANGVPGESPDYEWSGLWEGATSRSSAEWTAEIFIPISTLNVKLRDGLAIRANFARNEQGLLERSSWTPRVGTFSNAVYFGNVFFGRRSDVPVANVVFPGDFSSGPTVVRLDIRNSGTAPVTLEPVMRAAPGSSLHETTLKQVTVQPGSTVRLKAQLVLPEEPECGLDVWARFGDVIRRAKDSGLHDEVLLVSYRISPLVNRPKTLGAVLAKTSWGVVWEANATSKVMPDMLPPKERQSVVSVFCAKNEFEPFQIVLTPSVELYNPRILVSDFIGPATLPKSEISVRRVGTVPISRPTSPDCLPGDYPDPLLPMDSTSVPANRSTALWFTIHVPEDAKAGNYRGTITLLADGVKPVTIPVRLHVWDFALPEVSRLQTAYGCDYNAIYRWHGVSSAEDKRRTAELVIQNFIEHRVAPINPLPEWHIDTEAVNGELKADFSDYDQGASKFVPKLSAFNLPGAFMGKIGNDPPGTEGYARLKLPFLRQLGTYLRSKGWLDKAYCYMYDEPREEDYPKLVEEAKLWREADPGLRILLTEQPEKPLFGSVDIWTPVLDAYIRKNCQKRQAEGDEVWWYVCCGPHHPFPNNFIDYPAIDHRILHWMNWKYGVTGVLYWQTTFWQRNPWTEPMTVSEDGKKDFGNGDGVLLYPAVETKSETPLVAAPLDSIRWEMIREGIEDYDYLSMLSEAVKSAEARGDNKLAEIGKAALADAANMVRTTADYEKDPRKLYLVRRRIAEALERMR